MSEQGEGSTITSLEEVFLSREFGQASVRRGLPDGEFGDLPAAPQFEAVFVPEDFAAAPALEEVFLSEAFGRPEAVALRRRREAPLELIVPGDAVITPLHPTRDGTRYRAIAAVSGVAAAALVVAGVASGGGQAGRPTVSAQGVRVSAQGGGANNGTSPVPPITSATAPDATTVEQRGTGGTSFASPDGNTGVVVSTASLVVAAPSGTTPPPAPAPTSGSPSIGGSSAPTPTAPPLPAAPTDPLAPVLTSVGTTVSGLGTTVTSTVSQIESALPPVAPVTAVLGSGGTTLTSIGHAMRSPTR